MINSGKTNYTVVGAPAELNRSAIGENFTAMR
jgi:hypothetical protein